MNTSFWSHCQNLVYRLQQARPVASPRRRQRTSWIVEGLEARTLLSSTPAMVADINPGAASSGPGDLIAIGSTTYFTANDGVHGNELWKSDGTAAGTAMVRDINPGSTSSNPTSLTNVNGTLFFTASDGVHGNELWKSDGTTAGTTLVKDIFPGSTIYNGYWGYSNTPNTSNPTNLTNVNGTLFFSAYNGTNGNELWKSDGTNGGTVIVSPAASNPHNFTNVSGTLFFSASDTVNGEELWKSDGTTAGTTLVKDIFPGMTKYYQGPYGGYVLQPSSSHPSNLTNVNGTLFFTAGDGAPGNLWKSDGTALGTVKVTGSTWVNSNAGLAEVNGTLYFSAYDGIHGSELWKSDGTAAGTALVTDIRSGSNGSYPNGFTNVNGTLYFSALDDVHGYELWKSDGTAAGTMMVKDIFPSGNINYGTNNYGNSNIGNLTNANGTLFFTAKDGVHGTELWALNTAPAPSLAVSGFPATTTAGVAGSFTVTAKNGDGTTNSGYTGTIHFTSTDPQAVLPADYTFTAADHGTRVFTANLKTAGYQSITATDKQSSSDNGIESSILVKPAAASTMTVAGFPSTTVAGVAGNVTVTLTDLYGNIATGYLGTVHLTSSDAKAALPANYTFTAADAGKHTLSATLKTAGTQSIKVVDTATPTLTGTELGIIVTPTKASQFFISAPSSVKAGVLFSLNLMVEDAYGNVVTGYTGTVHFTSTDNTALLPRNYTFTSVDKGVHTFTGLILRKKGNQKITITDTLNGSLTSSVVENVT